MLMYNVLLFIFDQTNVFLLAKPKHPSTKYLNKILIIISHFPPPSAL